MITDAEHKDVERAIELLAQARQTIDAASAKLCSIRDAACSSTWRRLGAISRELVIVRDALDADVNGPNGSRAGHRAEAVAVKYRAECSTCSFRGRSFAHKSDAVTDADEHEIAVGDNRKHHKTTVKEGR